MFDIIFDVLIPGRSEIVKMIINIEAQNEVQKLRYHIVTRGLYYAARSISAQKNVEFINSNYQDIKKVYSIWICIKCDLDIENTITEYSMGKKDIVGHYPRNDYYDLISVVQVCLSSEIIEADNDDKKLLRLLETFFASGISEAKRKDIIINEFKIPYSHEIERSMNEMCNASQGIKNEAMLEGRMKGMIEGKIEGKIEAYLDMGLSANEIGHKLEMSEKEVCDIISLISDRS